MTKPTWRERLAAALTRGAAKEPEAQTVTIKAADEPKTMTLQQLIDLLSDSRRIGSLWEQSTYYICLKRLSEGLSRMPLRVMQRMPDGGVREAVEHPLYRMLRTRPNRFTDAASFWAAAETCRAHNGNAYLWYRVTASGPELWLLPFDQVDVIYDDARKLADQPYLWYRWRGPDTRELLLSHEEVVHLRWPTSEDGIIGVPVREALRSTVEGNIKSQRVLNKLYDNGMTGKAVVQYTGNLNDANVQAMLKNMSAYANGEVDASQPLIPVPIGSSITPLNVKLTDSQFLELKRYSAAEIAAAFGINPNQINDYEKSSYASAMAQQLDFYVNTLMYITEHYEEALGWVLLSDSDTAAGYYVDFDERVALKADPQQQIETLRSAVSNGLLTPNEARAELERPAADGGDQLYTNGNIIPLILAGTQYGQGGATDAQTEGAGADSGT